MALIVKKEEPDWTKAVSANGYLNPPIKSSIVETNVLVENGGTVVMGGIYEHEEVGSGFKVPLLGDLPALGSFFRKTAREIRRTELLVFLTPTVIPDVQTPAR